MLQLRFDSLQRVLLVLLIGVISPRSLFMGGIAKHDF